MTIAGTSAGPAPAFRRGTPSWRGHFGAWRALTALPAMVGSLLLLLMLFGWLGQWEGLVLLASIAVCALAAPVTDAAASRASEYKADHFAAQTGYGDDLSRALTDIDAQRGILPLGSRLLGRHPATARHVQRLRQTPETLTSSI